ncbi:HRDC domain-containing protein [Nocardioides sp. TRM66260-LWL]|uniref:HRDC domain-containing protein n=1 Tax=Nocardioides sp. TRM66260-LWL TaxID=2874478 RepID=UPI001CC45C54|nr:HRDC domain-containing protein [Nocardioides sp. TRM66260-LWL]MBZ5734424.1 HRDC domain-containing protein [Nocardioides sp. TRM66260-LWL]
MTSDAAPGPQPDDLDAAEPEQAPEAPPAPLLTLRDGLPGVVDTPDALAACCAAIAGGTGPVAIDAERASGYRYSSRAYLIQLRRAGTTTFLVDPIAFDDLAPLQEAIGEAEWILHAATQDLPCLGEVGLHPHALFDTELAGRLLGYPRVGLATLVETLLGWRMKKEHSAVDWSTRPLPEPWLEYAALDVEVLVELRDLLAAELEAAGKAEWARQEFDHLRSFEPTVRTEAWRRTSGLHRVRGRRNLGAVRALWGLRDEIARQRDVTPGRILPDSAIVAAATALPLERSQLLTVRGFHGRGAERYSTRWVAALREVAELPESELPQRAPRTDGPPLPRAWAEKDPVAARRLTIARDAVVALGERVSTPVENLLTPDLLRRLLWTPPAVREPQALAAAVAAQLADLGARPWQVELTTPLLVEAIVQGDVEPEPADGTDPDAGAAGAPGNPDAGAAD